MSFKKKFLRLCLACILILGCSISGMAAPSDCKLTVKLFDKNKQAIDGLQVSICKVADIIGTDYYPTEEFANSGISIAGVVNHPTAETANTIYQYVKKEQIASRSAYSQNGQVVFDSLDRAIWLVFCQEEQSHCFNPYLVFLPQTIGGKVQYEVVAEPKVEEYNKGDSGRVEQETVLPNTPPTGDKLLHSEQIFGFLLLAVASSWCVVDILKKKCGKHVD